MTKKNISIKEIAKLANVSVATVSRVINNNGRFSEATKERVEKIIKEYLNTHKPQVCYKHVFNKFLLNSIRNKEQTKIKKTVSADYGYSKKNMVIQRILQPKV